MGDSIFKRAIDKYRNREIKKIKNNNKPIYYIIRRKPLGEGFFSNYFYVLSHIIYAKNKGWISVIDMNNYKTLYSEDSMFMDTENAWEYYFEQPQSVTLDAAYQSNNYVLSKDAYYGQLGVPVYEINHGQITKEMVKKLYPLQKEYIPIKQYIIQEVDDFYKRELENGINVGVHIRGTDMKVRRHGHSLPHGLDEIINEIKRIEKKEQSITVFLCCDEKEVIETLSQMLSCRVITTSAYRSENTTTTGIHFQSDCRTNHKYLMGKEVLEDALLLARCQYLICGVVSNVTSAAILFNNLQYKEVITIM